MGMATPERILKWEAPYIEPVVLSGGRQLFPNERIEQSRIVGYSPIWVCKSCRKGQDWCRCSWR